MAESDDKLDTEKVEVTAETPLIESVSEDVSKLPCQLIIRYY